MGFIKCCDKYWKARTFALHPNAEYQNAQIDLLEECPICSHRTLQLTRIDFDNHVSFLRYINEKADKNFNKLKNSIKYEIKDALGGVTGGSKFYLNYNEYGVKKKCYSNLSTLKIGLFENLDLKKFEANAPKLLPV